MSHLILPTKHSPSIGAQQWKGMLYSVSKHLPTHDYQLSHDRLFIFNHRSIALVFQNWLSSLYIFYSCKDCLGLNSPCGWCNFNKKCSGTSALCRNASHFLQVSSITTVTCDSIHPLYRCLEATTLLPSAPCWTYPPLVDTLNQ